MAGKTATYRRLAAELPLLQLRKNLPKEVPSVVRMRHVGATDQVELVEDLAVANFVAPADPWAAGFVVDDAGAVIGVIRHRHSVPHVVRARATSGVLGRAERTEKPQIQQRM